jgi:hypothetical protein
MQALTKSQQLASMPKIHWNDIAFAEFDTRSLNLKVVYDCGCPTTYVEGMMALTLKNQLKEQRYFVRTI